VPGIVGLISKMPRERATAELCAMVEALRHESFYVTGMWIDEYLGVYVGWVARRGSSSDGMPVRNEGGDVVLAFAGEEYPEPGTVDRLKARGHGVEREGLSYLVHLYEEAPDFPAGLNGRFHGLIIDRRRGRALLFNDRYGMRRTYYYDGKEGFYFAAEAKAILAVCSELRRADPRGLGEFVSCGCVLENRTVFRGIELLPGGSLWSFHAGAIEQKSTYFNPREWEDQAPLEPEAYYKQVLQVFSRNLDRYFGGQERVGMSLTGGLDTRMIMAWRKPPAATLPCYTFGGVFRDCRDVTIARKVAHACGQSHEVIRAGDEFLSRFPYYAERTMYLTDACVEVSCAPVLYVNEKARNIAPVRMTGNYGDQILRRLRSFKPWEPAPGPFVPEFLSHAHAAAETYGRLLQTHPLSFAAFRQAPWSHYGLLALEETQVTMRSPYMDDDLVRLNFRAPESACANNDLRLRLIGDGNPALLRFRTDLGFGGAPGYLRGEAFRRFQLFTFKAEYAYDHGMPQWMSRIDHVFSPLRLERLFLGRHKYYHFRVWYRDVVSKYVQDMLLDPRTLARPYLNRVGIQAIVQGHLRGGRNYTNEIHKVLSLELMHRLFLDSR
jgi:asparagine synthase (glutamine-hydrolysing)